MAPPHAVLGHHWPRAVLHFLQYAGKGTGTGATGTM